MDRLKTLALGGGLGLILAATGCRTPKSEVPTGRTTVKDAATMPPVQFSSEPSQQVAPPSMSPAGTGPSGLGSPPTTVVPGVPMTPSSAGQAPSLTLPPQGAMNSRLATPPRPNFGPGAAPGSDLPDLSGPGVPN